MIVREALVADPPILQTGEPVQTAAALLVKPHVESVLVADGERAQAAEQDFALGHGANRFLSARNRASYR